MAKRSDTPKFENEAALVAAFCANLERHNQNPRMAEDEKWTAYHETAGWVPEYVPDVTGGHAAPVALTVWKIKAIKLLILLERRGYVTRADMKALQISPTRWTDHWSGFLSADSIKGGYVQNSRTPDLRGQHPTNYAQIEADFEKWGAEFVKLGGATGPLFGSAA